MLKKISPSLEDWFLLRVSSSFARAVTTPDLLENLTVIIPSYCRQPFLLRQIVYWMNIPVKVIIADGSPEPISSRLKEVISRLPNIQYINNPVNFIERISELKNSITTPYVVMLGDDEFHLRSGLSLAMEKLQCNSDLAGCIGQSIRFFVDPNQSKIIYGTGYSHYKFELLEEDIVDRFFHAMKNYNAATCYAVLRTDAWQDSWASMLKTSCKDVAEAQQALATHISGKFTTVEQIYWLRSNENESIPDRKHFRDIGFSTWWSSGRYHDERTALVRSLGAIVQKYRYCSDSEAMSTANKGLEMFNEFYKQSHPRSSFFALAKVKGYLATLLKMALPSLLYKTLKNRILPKVEIDPSKLGDIGSRELLLQEACKSLFLFDSRTDEDLRAVESLIFEFYKHH